MKILSISKSTFKEAVRDRIFIVLLAFGCIFIGLTIFLGSLSLGENATIMRDFGLAGIYLFTIITAIFSGTNVVGREIERGTSRVILSRPVSEAQFVAGKFLGLWSAIALVTISMTALFSIVMALQGFFFISLFWPNLLLLFEVPLLIALSVLFGVLSSPLAGTMYTTLFLFI
ncbi:MAG TPA: ABC transporter permease subunit, partial [bacterium]|nr:ABC transporter permease subunit [bacterium]